MYMNPKSTDADLIKKYLSGNEFAFEKLYKRYEKPLYGFIYKFVRNKAVTDDVFQQTWHKVIRALPKYTERGKFSSWVFGIANNACIDYVRRKDVALKDEAFSAERMDELPDADGMQDDKMINMEDKLWLKEAVSKLPPEQKQVVLLRLYAEMSFKEIAKELNCSINTVLGRMHYAVNHLKKMNYEVTKNGL